MECFASLAMTAEAMDCFAEPAIGRACARPASRGEAANVRLAVIASAAKQSILSYCGDGVLRFARNDGRGNGLLRGACHRARMCATRIARRGRECAFSRHCERSEAIHSFFAARWIASLRSQ